MSFFYILILIVANKHIQAKPNTTRLPEIVIKNLFCNLSLKLSLIVILYVLSVLYKRNPNKATYKIFCNNIFVGKFLL